MEEKTYYVSLTYDELLLLDGKCRETIQTEINLHKEEKKYNFPIPLFGEVLAQALKEGEYSMRYDYHCRYCPICKKKAETKTFQSGKRRGQTIGGFLGITYNEGFVHFTSTCQICGDCEKQYNLNNEIHDFIMKNDLPIQTKFEGSTWKKDRMLICFKCNAEMYESEMRRSPTLTGDGTYPSTCPYCQAKSEVFGRNHNYDKKHRFRMIKK